MEGRCSTWRGGREVGVFGQVTDGCDGVGPQRGSGRDPPVVSARFPPKSAVPPVRPRPTVPRCGPLSAARPFGIVGGRLLGPETHSRYRVGEHRSDVSVPVTDARPLLPCRPSAGVRHRARGCAERSSSENSQVARAAAAVSLGDPLGSPPPPVEAEFSACDENQCTAPSPVT